MNLLSGVRTLCRRASLRAGVLVLFGLGICKQVFVGSRPLCFLLSFCTLSFFSKNLGVEVDITVVEKEALKVPAFTIPHAGLKKIRPGKLKKCF